MLLNLFIKTLSLMNKMIKSDLITLLFDKPESPENIQLQQILAESDTDI